MKQGNTAIRVTMIVIFLGILAYFGIYVYQSLNSAVELATVYSYTAEDRTEVSGFLVRSESVVDFVQGNIVEITVEEGEKVGVGNTIAKIYSSDIAASRQQEIANLTEQLEQLKYIQSRSLATADTMELDNRIQETLLTVRANVSDGELSGLNSEIVELESLVFRRDYTYSGVDNLSEDIASLELRLDTLETEANQDTQYVASPVSGVFFGSVDGYEGALTVDQLDNLTPSQVDSWKDLQQTVEEGQYIGKLITRQVWYFATTMDEEEADRMGSQVTLRFTNDFSQAITMKVHSISKPENGRVAVVLSTADNLLDTANMRYQGADIVYDSTTGFRVPLSAVRINEDGVQGIYVITGTQAEWKPVQVVYQGADFCLVQSLEEGEATELREGDTVIVRGKNIYDGKVIE